jgi:hypothetical protein
MAARLLMHPKLECVFGPEAQAAALENLADQKNAFCCRCGQLYDHCMHINCTTTGDDEHAERIRARYAIGKEFNPEHDSADYTDNGTAYRAGERWSKENAL